MPTKCITLTTFFCVLGYNACLWWGKAWVSVRRWGADHPRRPTVIICSDNHRQRSERSLLQCCVHRDSRVRVILSVTKRRGEQLKLELTALTSRDDITAKTLQLPLSCAAYCSSPLSTRSHWLLVPVYELIPPTLLQPVREIGLRLNRNSRLRLVLPNDIWRLFRSPTYVGGPISPP